MITLERGSVTADLIGLTEPYMLPVERFAMWYFYS